MVLIGALLCNFKTFKKIIDEEDMESKKEGKVESSERNVHCRICEKEIGISYHQNE